MCVGCVFVIVCASASVNVCMYGRVRLCLCVTRCASAAVRACVHARVFVCGQQQADPITNKCSTLPKS